MFGSASRKSEELFLQMTTSQIDDDELIKHQKIMMHDTNIEEITKTKILVLALLLFFTNDREQIEHQHPMVHDVNIEEKTKAEFSVLACHSFHDQVNTTPQIKDTP